MSSAWIGAVPPCNNCGRQPKSFFLDAPAEPGGPWGIWCGTCAADLGLTRTGVSIGQMYKRDPDGSFVKILPRKPAAANWPGVKV